MKEFVKPWMAKCNSQLILRYWHSKGCPGQATVIMYGVASTHIMIPFGEVVMIGNQYIINKGGNERWNVK